LHHVVSKFGLPHKAYLHTLKREFVSTPTTFA